MDDKQILRGKIAFWPDKTRPELCDQINALQGALHSALENVKTANSEILHLRDLLNQARVELQRIHSVEDPGSRSQWDWKAPPDPSLTFSQLLDYSRLWPSLKFVIRSCEVAIHDPHAFDRYSSSSISSFTGRICRWVKKTFGLGVLKSKWERSMRVAEEAVELLQACGISYHELAQVIGRVYSRPPGDIPQEAAGLMICLLAWGYAYDVDIEEVAKKELNRIETTDVERFREKQQQKALAGIALAPEKKHE